ncbi:xanthine dehydrogenase family protein subunit M [Acidobacteria bacterium AH-259-D05]|nr:xanthine dehydrogenase family protein subunit M [Acidobacteria bacterium AH-259-D05]
MKPPKFDYQDPDTVEEALDLLQQYGYDAKILAGGQSLVPLMNFRLARPEVLIDINKIKDLDYVRETDGKLAIGAMTRQSILEFSETIRSKCGLLAESAELIGHPQTRNRGTVGGSIAHADPTAELTAIARALDAEMKIRSQEGERTVSAEDFFLSVMTTTLEPTEMLVEVQFPVLTSSTGWAFEEFVLRHGDFAVVGVTATVTLDAREVCTDARLAAIGVDEIAFRDPAIEELLKGEKISDSLLEEVGSQLSEKVDPFDDLHASAQQRKHLAGVLAKRAVKKAAEVALQNLKGEK